MVYLPLFTLPAAVPSGYVLVHNNVRPTRRLSSRGFRAWLSVLDDKLERCPCSFAADLGLHYRVVAARVRAEA